MGDRDFAEMGDFADLLSPAEAGQVLGLTADRVRQLCNSGHLDFRLSPLGRLIVADSLFAFQRRRGLRRVVPREVAALFVEER